MPSRVEDYEVLYTIGSGSYGKCQKIRRKSDGKVLVWKELDYGTMTEAEKQMLVSEVNLLRELKHPNIVRYYDRIIDRTNTTLYIVMEYCEGGDLASLITRCIKERRYLDEELILRVLAQLTLALKECHRRSDGGHTVLHRDLKPANIFLDAKQNVKLGDFGLARILNHDTSFAKTYVGTPYYMSPAPFTAYNQKDLAEKIREGKFRRIPYRYSEELNTVLSRMLNLKDYLRPSVEAIIQNPLIEEMVAEEQRKNVEKNRRRSTDNEKIEPSDSLAAELKLKEQQLQERERALKEREARLERTERERELCVRESLSNEKLARAENLMKNYNLMKQQKVISTVFSNALDEYMDEDSSPGKKKVHFAGDSKENEKPDIIKEKELLNKEKCQDLKKRLQAANLRAKSLM